LWFARVGVKQVTNGLVTQQKTEDTTKESFFSAGFFSVVIQVADSQLGVSSRCYLHIIQNKLIPKLDLL